MAQIRKVTGPAPPRRRSPATMNMGGLQVPDEKPFDCGIHKVTYMAFKAGCPVCHAEREIEQMRAALQEVKGKMEVLTSENLKLRTQVDIVTAMREAALLLDDNDLEFFKVTLYQWRDEKSLGLKTTHGARMKQRKGEPLPANGFIVMPRAGDPYGHVCSSIGGVAIAEYFDEATNTVGSAQAMAFLVKGLAHQLPGVVKK
jgi:hypothetical protein